MDTENFDPVATKLNTQINLIEASAGTGKTYAIALLVLRFVVEKNLAIEQLLVVTFTKASTEELRDRIRTKLVEAKQLVHDRQHHLDENILKWLDGLTLDKNLVKTRLETALLNIDQAGIFTIHSFCQRILTEHALESGQLFNVELTTDSEGIKQRCTDDYWRKQLYPRTALQVALLTSAYHTPETLLDSIAYVPLSAKVIPDAGDLDALLQIIEQLINQAQSQFTPIYQILTNAFAEGNFKTRYLETFAEQAKKLQQWLNGQSVSLPEAKVLNLFSDQSINAALNGAKFRKTKLQSNGERKIAYIKTLVLDNAVFNELATAIKKLALHFRLGLVNYLRKNVNAYLQQQNQLTFDELISRLSTALANDKRRLLIRTLQQRFKVALIDEFQDTDNMQWTIFNLLFSATTHSLYLIGDPKQAIYKFRGADIFSYFTAKENAHYLFTLKYNWRSHPHLVTAVNTLFSRDHAFLFENLPFNPVKPALTNEAGAICYQQRPLAPMVLWQLGESNSNTGDWSAGNAAKVIKIAVVNEIIDLLANHNYSLKRQHQPLKLAPKAIAILVKNNQQARDYQLALQQRGIPAVLKSTESVFASAQAFELYQLLQAVIMAADRERLKQALMLDWFGLQRQDFYSLINNETELDGWVSRFNDYHLLWQQHGLMVMMSRLFTNEKVHQHLSARPLAERILTNVHHLIELLQKTATEQHLGIHKTLDYLSKAIQDTNSGVDDQPLRLESDDEAVSIVTLHSAKGLEYDIVFCPFLWQYHDNLKQEQSLISCHINGKMITDLGSPDFENHRSKALVEQLAEDLRLVYVALTRAKYRCYITWANVRSQLTPNHSALAYLMDFYADDFSVQQQKLRHLSDEHAAVFAYHLIDPKIELKGYYQVKQVLVKFNAKFRKRRFENNWQMSSYTALATLSNKKSSKLPGDEAQETKRIVKDESLILALPRGPHTGNVIHSLLQFNSFKKLADLETDISQQREQSCLRYGLTLEQPELINQLLQTVVSTPLSLVDENFCLKNLYHHQCIKEMPFYLAINLFNVNEVNHLLKQCLTYRPLTEKQLEGYLTGFIDLICKYDGRYYLMDYKTNYLNNYGTESLIKAMHEHNYGLQYWLYSGVLHLYLQNRLPDYNYQQHFGGVRYLFVRGMIAEQALSGVYETRPDLETLDALVSIFGKIN